MRTSPTGKKRSNGHGPPRPVNAQARLNHLGFTFVELMVVVGIFTLVLLFSIPLFRQIHLTSTASDHVSGLILFLENLKRRAMVENKNFTLHMDPGSREIYVTDDTMDADDRQAARSHGKSLDNDLQLSDLEFPDDAHRTVDDNRICFFSKGYSDRALIHLRDQERQMTIQICMFQKKIHLIDGYVSYDDCI